MELDTILGSNFSGNATFTKSIFKLLTHLLGVELKLVLKSFHPVNRKHWKRNITITTLQKAEMETQLLYVQKYHKPGYMLMS